MNNDSYNPSMKNDNRKTMWIVAAIAVIALLAYMMYSSSHKDMPNNTSAYNSNPVTNTDNNNDTTNTNQTR